jgi:hypothetical protein
VAKATYVWANIIGGASWQIPGLVSPYKKTLRKACAKLASFEVVQSLSGLI